MFVLHLALQGCLKGKDVEYGLTSDTGGHIRYLLDLVTECERASPTDRIVIATRRFSGISPEYERPRERVSTRIEIVRLPTARPDYLAKEELHTEVESFAENLIAFIEREGRPDLVHAHYADAASVAAIVEERLGIPYFFTAHSLGRVKQAVLGANAEDLPGLAERIEAEEKAVAGATLLIASSRDEAEVQYAMYRNYEPGRIRVLQPGSDLRAFRNGQPNPFVDGELARFLTDPGKPPLLAIARPVRKKNLAALVQAFGENRALRRHANLVLVAGNRDDIDAPGDEMAETMSDLIHLIDRYDLYGSVAYPKQHHPRDVPAFYAYARQRHGIFVNPALNEPFGLTLLEASAAGLPLVATDSGGPNDIVETCGNGILVDPRDPAAIAEAALRILRDRDLWQRFAKGGAKAATAFSWPRHVARYAELAKRTITPTPHEATRQLLICDIDNTLVGCEDSIRAFGDWRRGQPDLGFGVATGRSFHSAMAILEQENAPRPQVMITSVGSEIYHLDANGVSYTADDDWRRLVSRQWDREGAAAALASVAGLTPQAPLEQRMFKLSYFSDGDPDTVRRVRHRLERVGLRASVIHSHGRYLDILPINASKGTAVDFVRRKFGLAQDAVFVAGDSGNDVEMLRTVPQSIIVANHSDGLPSLPALRHSYVARTTHALGVIEGVNYFRARAVAPCKQVS